ncbi:MAG TPA: hypothetical protein VFB62_19985, partial [Polyangiaceae bacterium]|nr:hypothetical protein [Polyangiaceae bacterium]
IEELEATLATQAKTDRGKLDEETLNRYERELAHARDLVNQYEARQLRKETFGPNWDVRGRALRGLAVVALSGVATFSLTKLPACLIESADKDSDACFEAFDQGEHDDPMSCRQRATLLWPSIIPWKRKEAVAEANDIHESALRRAMIVATAGDLDATQRSEVAASAAELEPEDRFRILVAGGDFEALAHLEELPDDKTSFGAALALGDIERARHYATRPNRAHEATLRQGAWLCLNGDAEAGRRALVTADAQYRAVVSGPTGWFDARAAAAACGLAENDATLETRLVPSFARASMTFVRLLDPSWQKGRRVAVAESLFGATLDGHERVVAMAHWLVGARPSTLAVDKKLGDPKIGVRDHTLASPFAVLRHDDLHDQPIVDPSTLEAAATVLEELPPIEASTDPGARKPEGVTWELQRAAFIMWLEAAAYHAREGWTEKAKRAAARAVKIAPEGLDWLAAGVLLAAGDATTAKRLVTAATKRADFAKADRSMAYLHLAWAEIELGRWDDALEHARLAHAASLSVRTAWLLAALTLRAGKPVSIEGLPSAPDDMNAWNEPLPALSGFLRLAAMPEKERRRARIAVSQLSWVGETLDVLPAALFVVGAAAGTGNVEVWLDRMCALEMAIEPDDLRLWMRARAAAARWRGDEAAMTRWNERLARLGGLVKDPRAAVIAHAGGL